MSRPKKGDTKTKAIRVRMTEDDFLIVTIFAEQCGITKSGLMMAGIHNLIRMLDDDDFMKLNEKVIQAKNKWYERDHGGADFDGLSDGPFEPKTASWTP